MSPGLGEAVQLVRVKDARGGGILRGGAELGLDGGGVVAEL